MAFDPASVELGRLYTRPELALLWGYRGHEAISRGVFTPTGGGHIVLFVTRQKQQSLTQYRDFVSGDYLHWEGESGHGNDRRIARAHETGEEIHLFYRDIHHTPFRYYGRIVVIRFIEKQSAPSEFVFRLVHDLSAQDDVERAKPELTHLPETERDAIVRARVGQGLFRERLLELWGACAVTGIEQPDLLRASHIKPWRYSTHEERLNRFNGLLLLPQYDHLFDRGYITFDGEGRLEPSPAIVTLPPERLGIELNARLREMAAEHIDFLEYHRREVFLHRTSRD